MKNIILTMKRELEKEPKILYLVKPMWEIPESGGSGI